MEFLETSNKISLVCMYVVAFDESNMKVPTEYDHGRGR